MKFDLFHSIGRIDSLAQKMRDRQVFQSFFDQAALADQLGFLAVWVAESHFSSEVQKSHKKPVIPHYQGEVGLNCDSFQLFHRIVAATKRIGFGTAILNIVGGNGGPIAAADRVRQLQWHNSFLDQPRALHIGVASGRFPYINQPFGICPRSEWEEQAWSQVQRFIFLEALEIFLRLVQGESLASSQLRTYSLTRELIGDDTLFERITQSYRQQYELPDHASSIELPTRWTFEQLQLVPELDEQAKQHVVRYVLGSSDPEARKLAAALTDIDLFNLSFTPPDKINVLHSEMQSLHQQYGRQWARWRLPRTVLVFLDKDRNRAYEMAEHCFDVYIEAMRGTVQMPPKSLLMERALIGDPQEMVDQLTPGSPKGFDADDRLMLWFEFNQTDPEKIQSQMKLFSDKVMPQFL